MTQPPLTESWHADLTGALVDGADFTGARVFGAVMPDGSRTYNRTNDGRRLQWEPTT